ncbi:Glucanosyltransferase-domain-containing protein [Hypoxylon sp. FL1284]|nr:Glucanosyltransferase-domain-containing protein [Hypoxylon sp. FL1284]
MATFRVDRAVPITIKGRYFWRDDKRFMLNGFSYQPGSVQDGVWKHVDPLANSQLPTLQRSLPVLRELKINTLFVYYIDETQNHDLAMYTLAAYGIYVLPCLCGQSRQLKADMLSETYTAQLLSSCFEAVDAMSRYNNTLGFMIANQYIDSCNATFAAPYLRALTRDIKKHMAVSAEKQRVVPVGLSATNLGYTLKHQFEYFSAGPDEEAVDFFATTIRAGPAYRAVNEPHYIEEIDMFRSSPIPLFWSHCGVACPEPLPVADAYALFTYESALCVFSGGIVHEFFRGNHSRGLVIESCARINNRTDYDALRKVLPCVFPPAALERQTLGLGNRRQDCGSGEQKHTMVDSDDILEEYFKPALERPKLPSPGHNHWNVPHKLPRSPLDLAEPEPQPETDNEDADWHDVDRDIRQMEGDDLEMEIEDDLRFGIQDKLIIDEDAGYAEAAKERNGGSSSGADEDKEGTACDIM